MIELAAVAEQRDELELAAEHYETAWRILPDRRTVLVDLARSWKSLNGVNDRNAALWEANGAPRRGRGSCRTVIPTFQSFAGRLHWTPATCS